MNAGENGFDSGQIVQLVAQIGALPDAPLAMPKQRLEPVGEVGSGLISALLRPFAARASRG